jgi:hypothetical protein
MEGKEFLSQVLHKPPFSKMHPQIAAFFKDYLDHEKVIEFDGKLVLNTHSPP